MRRESMSKPDQMPEKAYTLFKNGGNFNIILCTFKLALLISFLSSTFKRIFYLKQGKKGQFESRQTKNIKIATTL